MRRACQQSSLSSGVGVGGFRAARVYTFSFNLARSVPKMRCLPCRAALALLFVLASCAAPTFAQEGSPTPSVPDEPPPIADNSFLIEEAYNQEPGIVQHINTFTRQRNGDWLYTFTQEWPFFSQRHQLSYTIPVQRFDGSPDSINGVGDVALNYRYQLLGIGDGRVAIAPRVSVLLPTGDEKKELGKGGTGIQLNLPVSIALTRKFVTHTNAGATFTPSAKNVLGEKAHTKDYNLGQSLIWLAAPNFNVLLEAVYNSAESVVGPRRTEREHELLLNPGARFALNFRSSLQIVPGISFPVGVGPSRGERGVFFYLSLEHPFRKTRE